MKAYNGFTEQETAAIRYTARKNLEKRLAKRKKK